MGHQLLRRPRTGCCRDDCDRLVREMSRGQCSRADDPEQREILGEASRRTCRASTCRPDLEVSGRVPAGYRTPRQSTAGLRSSMSGDTCTACPAATSDYPGPETDAIADHADAVRRAPGAGDAGPEPAADPNDAVTAAIRDGIAVHALVIALFPHA